MDFYEHFYIDKMTLTFADELKKDGFIHLLYALLYQQFEGEDVPYRIEQRDQGGYYLITCDPPLAAETLDAFNAFSGTLMPLKFIRTVKNEASLLSDNNYWIDYEEKREQATRYFEARKKGGDASGTPLPSDWDHLRAINPAALPGYNGVVESWWRIQPNLSIVLHFLLTLYSSTPNPVDDAIAEWKRLDQHYGWGIKPETTGQQLYNPDQGKGQNKTKADGMSIGNMNNFWLEEYLKTLGFWKFALTKTVRGSKDRKTFVVVPRHLDYNWQHTLHDEFMQAMQFGETATKFDILAALRYTQTLLKHYMEEQPSEWFEDDSFTPRKTVAGFRTAYYKKLGNAVATMNLAFIALPGWVRAASPEEANTYQDILEELINVVRQFDESHSEAFTLLQHLRDFVSGDDLAAFFRFTNAFPSYYMGMRERGKYALALSTLFIERLIMSTDVSLSRILETEGFQKIAYAIRQSTVTAQYQKKQGNRKYDVRYGLGQELARKARYPADFIVALSDFLHKYNAENAQIMETRSGPYRKSITTEDIEEVVALIDEYGSQTIANMLIAYGYARLPREDNNSQNPNPELTNEEGDN